MRVHDCSLKQLRLLCLNLVCATAMSFSETGDTIGLLLAQGFITGLGLYSVLCFAVSRPPGRCYTPPLSVEMGQRSLRDSLASRTFA
ncbi:uncharacterized [Tachysurus ichikawai]